MQSIFCRAASSRQIQLVPDGSTGSGFLRPPGGNRKRLRECRQYLHLQLLWPPHFAVGMHHAKVAHRSKQDRHGQIKPSTLCSDRRQAQLCRGLNVTLLKARRLSCIAPRRRQPYRCSRKQSWVYVDARLRRSSTFNTRGEATARRCGHLVRFSIASFTKSGRCSQSTSAHTLVTRGETKYTAAPVTSVEHG
jgi:hypothetical protein